MVPILGILALWTVIFALVLSFTSGRAKAEEAPRNTAIMLIDMQDGFKPRPKERAAIALWDRLVVQQIEFLDWAKTHSIPVIVLEYVGEGPTVKPLAKKLSEFPDGHVVRIQKDEDGAFNDRHARVHILETLKLWNADHVITCGVNGTACVVRTVYGALSERLNVSTSPEVVGDFTHWITRFPSRISMSTDSGAPFRSFDQRSELQSCEAFLHNEIPRDLSALPQNPFLSFLQRFWF